jgi:hypothetical protein
MKQGACILSKKWAWWGAKKKKAYKNHACCNGQNPIRRVTDEFGFKKFPQSCGLRGVFIHEKPF